jgi:hypothetical protein
MDTRAKIVSPQEIAGRGAVAVVGRFDLLSAALVRDLARLREESADAPVVAVTVPAADAVQSLRARAEMAAALAVIDYVLILEATDLEGLLAALRPARIVRREEADARLARELEAHVRNRHSG